MNFKVFYSWFFKPVSSVTYMSPSPELVYASTKYSVQSEKTSIPKRIWVLGVCRLWVTYLFLTVATSATGSVSTSFSNGQPRTWQAVNQHNYRKPLVLGYTIKSGNGLIKPATPQQTFWFCLLRAARRLRWMKIRQPFFFCALLPRGIVRMIDVTVRRTALQAIYLHCSPTVGILELLIKRRGYWAMRYKRLIDLLVIVNARMCWLCYQGQQSASRNISKGHSAVWVPDIIAALVVSSLMALICCLVLLTQYLGCVSARTWVQDLWETKLRPNHIQAQRANCTDCRRPRSSDHGN